MKKIVLIDGRNQLYRMQYSPALKGLQTKKGFPTGAIFGCLSYSLLAVFKRLPDAGFIWCWDGYGETWRHKMMNELPQVTSTHFPDEDEEEYESGATDRMAVEFQQGMLEGMLSSFGISNPKPRPYKKKNIGYKANRKYVEVKEGSYPTDDKERALIQIPVLKLILRGLGIHQYEIKALECDDLIGILAKKILNMDDEVKVIILSGDRDYYQLLKHDRVRVLKNMQGGQPQYVKPTGVQAEFGVTVEDWVKYRAWTGDSSDNIPHLYKVGPATARKMLADGLDPSVSKFENLDISEEVINKYQKYFPHGIEKMWQSVHGNYKLCKLILYPDDKMLSDEVRADIYKELNHITSVNQFGRHKDSRTTEAYRRLTMLLAKYELSSILAQRDTLWEIP